MVLGVFAPQSEASAVEKKAPPVPEKSPADVKPGKDSATKTPPLAIVRAYSLKTLKDESDVANDTLEKTPLVVFFDEVADTAAAYERELDGKILTFETKKLPSGKVLFYDKETGSRWNIEGKSEEGPLAGKTLKNLSSHLSEWYGWAGYFPQTSVYGKKDPPNSQKFIPPK